MANYPYRRPGTQLDDFRETIIEFQIGVEQDVRNAMAQISKLVAEGDSSPQAAAAAIDAFGNAYKSLKERLDSDQKRFTGEIISKADKTETMQAIARLGSATPKGAYATLAALNAAYPNGTTGLFVVTADNKWYYWNGTTWTPGNIYQGTAIAAGSITANAFTKESIRTALLHYGKEMNLFNPDMTFYAGYISGENGVINEGHTGYKYTDKIPLIANTQYSIKADWPTLGEMYKIHFYRADDTHIPGYATGLTKTGGTFTTPTDTAYIRISFEGIAKMKETVIVVGGTIPEKVVPYGAAFDFVRLPQETINKIIKDEDISYTSITRNLFNKDALTTGKQVYGDGTIRDTPPGTKSAITERIYVAGADSIYISGLTVYKAENLGGKYYAFYDKEGKPLAPIGTNISNTLTEAKLSVPKGSEYLIFSPYQWIPLDMEIDLNTIQIEIGPVKTAFVPYKKAIKNIKNMEIIATSPATGTTGKKLLFFGDSNTETAKVSDDGATYEEGWRNNWPAYVKRSLNAAEMWNYAKSGASYRDRNLEPRQYLGYQIQSAINNNRPGDIIAVACGTNDGGSSGDYATAMSKTTRESLDTKNNLYEAIRWAFWTIRLNYPDAVCFAITPIQRASREPIPALSNAIKEMAKRYNFIVIDAEYESGIVRDFEKPDANGRFLSDGLHMNTAGVQRLGEYISRSIKNAINY